MQINELAYDSAVKYFESIPHDTAEYKAFKTMQASHNIWKRAANDSIRLSETVIEKLDKLSIISNISEKL